MATLWWYGALMSQTIDLWEWSCAVVVSIGMTIATWYILLDATTRGNNNNSSNKPRTLRERIWKWWRKRSKVTKHSIVRLTNKRYYVYGTKYRTAKVCQKRYQKFLTRNYGTFGRVLSGNGTSVLCLVTTANESETAGY
jgi:hypothetical protein